MRRPIAIVLMTLVPLLALPAAAGPARANSTHDLSLTGFRDIVVDEAHGHVFISQGTSTVVVTDLSGTKVGTIDGLDGAGSMTMSDDGSKLFVALADGHGVAEVDAEAPLSTTPTFIDTGNDTCPLQVAFTSGLVWVVSLCVGSAELFAIDPATHDVVDTGQFSDITISASPALDDRLILEGGGFPEQLTEAITTASPTPAITGYQQSDSKGVIGYRHAAVTASGSAIVTGSGQAFDTSTLALTHTYRVPKFSSGYTDAVAVRGSDGMVALGQETEIGLYQPDDTKPWRVYDWHSLGQSTEVESDGLAFGTRDLYAVTSDDQGDRIRLRVITPRLLSTVSVTTNRHHFRFGQKAVITASVTKDDRGARVAIYATTLGQDRRHLLGRGKVDAKGHLTVRAKVAHSSRLTAVLEHTKRYDGASASARIRVALEIRAQFKGARGHRGKYALYSVNQQAYLLAHVLPDRSDSCLNFEIEYFTHGRWTHPRSTRCVSLRSHSRAAAVLKGEPSLLGIPFRMAAYYSGDQANARSVSPWWYAEFVR